MYLIKQAFKLTFLLQFWVFLLFSGEGKGMVVPITKQSGGLFRSFVIPNRPQFSKEFFPSTAFYNVVSQKKEETSAQEGNDHITFSFDPRCSFKDAYTLFGIPIVHTSVPFKNPRENGLSFLMQTSSLCNRKNQPAFSLPFSSLEEKAPNDTLCQMDASAQWWTNLSDEQKYVLFMHMVQKMHEGAHYVVQLKDESKSAKIKFDHQEREHTLLMYNRKTLEEEKEKLAKEVIEKQEALRVLQQAAQEHEKKIELLIRESKDQNNELEKIKEKSETLKGKMRVMKVDKCELQQKVQTAANRYTLIEKELLAVTSKLQEAQTSNTNLQTQIITVTAEKYESENALETVEEKLTILKEECTHVTNESREMQKQNDALNAQVKMVEEAFAQSKKDHDQECALFRAQLVKEQEEKHAQCINHTVAIETLKKAHEAAQEQKKDEHKKLSQHIEALEQSVEEKMQQLHEINSQLGELQNKQKEDARSIAAFNEECHTSTQKMSRLCACVMYLYCVHRVSETYLQQLGWHTRFLAAENHKMITKQEELDRNLAEIQMNAPSSRHVGQPQAAPLRAEVSHLDIQRVHELQQRLSLERIFFCILFIGVNGWYHRERVTEYVLSLGR